MITKILFKPYLAGCYSFARRWVNKKMQDRVIPSTIHFFLTAYSFLVLAFWFFIISILPFKFTSYLPILIGMGIITLGIGYGLEKPAKKAIFQWGIEKEYKALTKQQKRRRNTRAFLFFWFCFFMFCFIGVKYFGGYLVKP